jgi:pyridoxal biosynthesis lyase PdxS
LSPALLAAIAQAALPLIQYLLSLPAQERQAAIDALTSAAKQTNQEVADFVAGSAADLADAQARLAALEAHPVVVASGLAATVATLKAELVARAAPLGTP